MYNQIASEWFPGPSVTGVMAWNTSYPSPAVAYSPWKAIGVTHVFVVRSKIATVIGVVMNPVPSALKRPKAVTLNEEFTVKPSAGLPDQAWVPRSEEHTS